MDKEIYEFARLLKDRDNKIFEGFIVGTVLEMSSDPKIQISPDEILHKENLIFAASLLDGYEREFEITGADMLFTDENCGETSVVNDGGLYANDHSHTITEISIDTNTLSVKGKIKWVDALKNGDTVILVPSSNDQMYIVIDKAVQYY